MGREPVKKVHRGPEISAPVSYLCQSFRRCNKDTLIKDLQTYHHGIVQPIRREVQHSLEEKWLPGPQIPLGSPVLVKDAQTRCHSLLCLAEAGKE